MEESERRAAAGSDDDVGAWGEASPRSDGFADRIPTELNERYSRLLERDCKAL